MASRLCQATGKDTRGDSKRISGFSCLLLEPRGCKQLPQCEAWPSPGAMLPHCRHCTPLPVHIQLCEELLAQGTELLSSSAPEPGPVHGQPTCLLPTLLLAAPILPSAPSAVVAAALPNHAVPCRRDGDEIYDDVEPVGWTRRSPGLLLSSVSQLPVHPHPRGGEYRRGLDAVWGETCSSESCEAPMSHGQRQGLC